MDDDLISRKEALNTVARALSPVTSLYQLIEADIRALPAADTAALAMREAACDLVKELVKIMRTFGDMNSVRSLTSAADAIHSLPIPDHAALLAAALALPEIAMMRNLLNEAMIKFENDRTLWTPEWQIWSVDTRAALAALEARHE